MPKHGFLTPKAISNRIKAKGLQKLKWYCQMCQKQCRDENGFKCHIMSESHQRQLLLVAENPGKFIGSFSHEFMVGYLEILRRSYGTRRVHCNVVYQDYIKDRNHFHMNATRWSSLTGFVRFLGREGICKVEPTPKGWFITYIDRSPEAMARQAAVDKKAKMERDDAERSQRMVEEQIMRALANRKRTDEEDTPVHTELVRSEEEDKISFSLISGPSAAPSSSGVAMKEEEPVVKQEEDTEEEGGWKTKTLCAQGPSLPNPLKMAELEARKKRMERKAESKKRNSLPTELDDSVQVEEMKREKRNRRDYWLHPGIVVKIVAKKLGQDYYKKKAVVEEVIDLYTAVVRVQEMGDRVKIDQSQLETVIPAIGKEVMMVNGAYRGSKAMMEALDVDNYSVRVRIAQGPFYGKVVERVPYEDVSKLA